MKFPKIQRQGQHDSLGQKGHLEPQSQPITAADPFQQVRGLNPSARVSLGSQPTLVRASPWPGRARYSGGLCFVSHGS